MRKSIQLLQLSIRSYTEEAGNLTYILILTWKVQKLLYLKVWGQHAQVSESVFIYVSFTPTNQHKTTSYSQRSTNYVQVNITATIITVYNQSSILMFYTKKCVESYTDIDAMGREYFIIFFFFQSCIMYNWFSKKIRKNS